MLDKKDSKILELLTENSKLTTSKLSKKTAFPITTIHNRIKKLEKEGVIKNYSLNLDYEKLGKPISAFILVTVNYELKDGTKLKQEDVAKNIKKLKGVENVHIVTGGTDIIIKIRVCDVKELNNFIVNELRNVRGVDKTQTMMVLNEY